MAKKLSKSKRIVSQSYPMIEDEDDRFFGFLDESKLKPHEFKIPLEKLKQIIHEAISYANTKSSRVILKIPQGVSASVIDKTYQKEGQELFKYFKKYYGDPAATAFACLGKHYTIVGKDQFRNRTLQKERMNSGWRYQYIAKESANNSKRFLSVSDIGTAEADFNAIINLKDSESDMVNIYVSVKNRTNTMGGQDWPKAIRALEDVANTDKNRTGPYICVFGIVMEKGARTIKCEQKSGLPYSYNTEVWLSDFFWPFFSNYPYEEIIKTVLDVLVEIGEQDGIDIEVPDKLLDAFGACCKDAGLLDEKGLFNDPYKLVNLFCGKIDK